jgi:hypothetical protein
VIRTAVAAWLAAALALPSAADIPGPPDEGTLRLAVWNAGLTRRGPGLLLRDLLSGADPQIAATVEVIAAAQADVLLLLAVDWDHDHVALDALSALLASAGAAYPHRFAAAPNRGMQTGLDLDGDGRFGTPDDAQGWGAFAGAEGMALLSRLPLDGAAARDFSAFLWPDLPGARLPEAGGVPFPSPEALSAQRLSTTGHWDVPVVLPGGGRLHVLAWHASPPVFGGPHDRNLRRNHDETRFWTLFLDGALPFAPPSGPVVLMGDANLDPVDGDGMGEAIRALLSHPALQDPAPRSAGGVAAQGPRDADHRGDPALDTVLWDGPRQPGNLRVAYVLPSAGLEVTAAGVLWPPPGAPLAETAAGASSHRLVWVDIRMPAD